MTESKAVKIVGSLLPPLLLAASPIDAPSQVLTLVSPNEQPFGTFGNSVAAAGDLDRDGFEDVIVAANQEEPDDSPTNAGRAYAFSGKDGSLLLELMAPDEYPGGYFGSSVAGAGDANQDGIADLIVGAPFLQRAYVFSGEDGSLLHELTSVISVPGGGFGRSVAGAGDTNQDGFPT